MLAVGGVLVAARYGGATVTPTEMLRRVLLFPAFIALVVGVIVGQLGGWPDMLATMLDRFALTLVPLALFSVGLRFKLKPQPGQWAPVALALSWKLLLAPLLLAEAALGLESALCGLRLLAVAAVSLLRLLRGLTAHLESGRATARGRAGLLLLHGATDGERGRGRQERRWRN